MYKRILLKLSGEALKQKDGKQVLDVESLKQFSKIISSLVKDDVQVCVVIGAGNIWRGKLANEIGIEPIPADFMGMLGTVINAVALSGNLKNEGIKSVVFSSVPAIDGVTLQYNPCDANKAIDEGNVVFLAGGTGKPFFTTDTAAAKRALELNCDAILMGKNSVEGVYDKDPRVYSDAKFYKTITYEEMLKMNLQIMDTSAIQLLLDKDIQIRVFNMEDPSNILKVAKGEDIGTVCKKGEN